MDDQAQFERNKEADAELLAQNDVNLPSRDQFEASHQDAVQHLRDTVNGGGSAPPPLPSAAGGVQLPKGYALDEQPAAPQLPKGYTLDQPAGEKPEGYFEGLWKNLPHPIDAIRGGFDASMAQIQKAKDAYAKGEYGTAAAHMTGALPVISSLAEGIPHGIEGSAEAIGKAREAAGSGHFADAATEAVRAVPLAGPIAASAIDQARQGNYRGAAGEATGAAVSALLPKAIGAAKSIPLLPKVASKLTPEVSSAVQFADQEGIPISAGTRTGDKFVKNVQAIAQNQPIASGIASRAQAGTRAALTRTGEGLADEAHPISATPETAGSGLQQELGQLSRTQGAGASAAYDKLEQIENDPANLAKLVSKNPATGKFQPNPIASPVDMRAAKVALKPVLDRLEQEMPLAQQQSSRGLLAIRNVLGQEDFVPASVADQNLSALKQLQREAVHPKTQFLATRAVNAVSPAVDAAVAKLGPDAVDALSEGRRLTKAKYATDATIDDLPLEPVRLFDKLTAGRDTNINLVRDVSSKAPGSIPAVGRAYLEGLFEKATSAEGKPGAGTAYSQWNKLGDATKRTLFPDAALRQRLDDFFTLAKTVADNPNPSGTAHVGSSLLTLSAGGVFLYNPVLGTAAVLAWPAVTKMLYSRGGASLLMSGLRMPLKATPAAGIIAGSIVRTAGSGAKPVSSGASVQTPPTETPATVGSQ